MSPDSNNCIPQKQKAIQLVGRDELILNSSKEIFSPGKFQVLCKIEAVGLCFSDLKLLNQFSEHARKSEIVSGIPKNILEEIPSYVPGDAATVPGHETVVRVVKIGSEVKNIEVGKRYIVQTDYRWLATANSVAALGYNFEGALQEYILMDQRIITSPEGNSMLIPVSETISSSALALIEPWACVENAYSCQERQSIKKDGLTLIVAEEKIEHGVLDDFFDKYGKPSQVTWVSKYSFPTNLDCVIHKADSISNIENNNCDDILYFGSNAETVEGLFCKISSHGILNIILCGGELERNVNTPIGRIHYGGIRIIGSTGENPGDSMRNIPRSGEIRPSDKINIVGAAGPMGLMHVVRNICHEAADIKVFASDIDDKRLKALTNVAEPLAQKKQVQYKSYNSAKTKVEELFDYTVIMAPVPDLVVSAAKTSSDRGIINIFAGIPSTIYADIDLNEYISKHLYYIGTSGSTIDDMKTVLNKIEKGTLDTNICVAAIAGLDGAIDGLKAVANRTITGKIIVYPDLKNVGLTTLERLSKTMLHVAECLKDGYWNKKAEEKLLEIYR